MSRLTYNIELASKPDRSGRRSVMIRLHMKGHKPARVLTGVKLEQAERHWAGLDKKRDKKAEWGKWVVRHTNKDAINQQILSEHLRIKEQVDTWQRAEPSLLLTPGILAERFRSASAMGTYYEQMLPILEEAKDQAYRTWTGKRTALLAFTKFAGKDLPTANLTPQLVGQFQQHLLKKRIDRSNTKMRASTVNTYLDSLHALHKSMLIASGISPKQAALLSPWNDRQRPDEVRSIKERLDESTIDRLSLVEVPTTRRKLTPELSFRVWMISHALAGARFSDIMQLRYMHFKTDEMGRPVHLNYEMMKTGFTINIPIFEETWDLLQPFWNPQSHKPTDYILPFLSTKQPFAQLITHEQYKNASFELRAKLAQTLSYWNGEMNKCLKEVAKKAKIKGNLSTHTSRHSFADLARRIMQQDKTITLYDIQHMLGHGDYKTTVGYIEELSGQDATSPMTAVFNRKKKDAT